MEVFKKISLKISLLDKYILKQLIEIFILGVVIFTSIIFASDTFITLIKQITLYGIPPKIALMLVLLNLPTFIVMTIPMSMLLSTVMSLNRLCLASEITVMRACGIGIARISKPIFIFAILMAILSFAVNETIVPMTNSQSKTLSLWALGQKNIPNGKRNFTIKELVDGNKLKRLFFVEKCENNQLENVTVLDLSNKDTIQLIQAKTGKTLPEGWLFYNASVYTMAGSGKILNTSWFGETTADFGMEFKDKMFKAEPKEFNFIKLFVHIAKNKEQFNAQEKIEYQIAFFDKLALPFTTIVLVLIGVPLAITPPRVRYNRGFLMSIFVIFIYYLIKALSLSFGESGTIAPFLASWLPNIILVIIGSLMYYRKAFKI